MARKPKTPTDLIPVENAPNLVRDPNSKAILNTDRHALHAARALKKQTLDDKATAAALVERVTKLEEQVAELHNLLAAK